MLRITKRRLSLNYCKSNKKRFSESRELHRKILSFREAIICQLLTYMVMARSTVEQRLRQLCQALTQEVRLTHQQWECIINDLMDLIVIKGLWGRHPTLVQRALTDWVIHSIAEVRVILAQMMHSLFGSVQLESIKATSSNSSIKDKLQKKSKIQEKEP